MRSPLEIKALVMTVGGHSNSDMAVGLRNWRMGPQVRLGGDRDLKGVLGRELQGVRELARKKGSPRQGDFVSHRRGHASKLQV